MEALMKQDSKLAAFIHEAPVYIILGDKEYAGLKTSREDRALEFKATSVNFGNSFKYDLMDINISNIKELAIFTSSKSPSLEDIQNRKPKVKEYKGAVLPLESLPDKYRLPLRPNEFDNHENNLIRVPKSHPWESLTSVYRIEENNSETIMVVNGIFADGEGNPVSSDRLSAKERKVATPYTNFPLPIGTPYLIRYSNLSLDGLHTGAYSNVDLSKELPATGKYTMVERMRDIMHDYYAHNCAPLMGKHLNIHTTHGHQVLQERSKNILITLFPNDSKYIPSECDQISLDGSRCGGHYIADMDDTFYCIKCGVAHPTRRNTYIPRTSMDDENGDETMSEHLENENESSDMASKYQPEEQPGSTLPPEMAALQARMEKNINNWRKLMGKAPEDEKAAKAALHEKVATHKRAKKAISKLMDAEKIYDSEESARKKSHRMAAIIFWTKKNGCIKSNELYNILKEHGIDVGHQKQLFRLLTELAEKGRVTISKQENKTGETNVRQPYLITYIK
jgi:hypothetical protein